MENTFSKDYLYLTRRSNDYRTFTFAADVSCLSNVAKQIFSNFIDVQISTEDKLSEALGACLPLHILPTALRHESFMTIRTYIGSKWTDEYSENVSHLMIYPRLEQLSDGQVEFSRDTFTLEVYYKI